MKQFSKSVEEELNGLKVFELKVCDNYQGTDLKSPMNNLIDFDESMLESFSEKYIFASSVQNLSKLSVHMLSEKGYTLSVAESLTGGSLASAIVGISGASMIFDVGVVSYSTRAKHSILGVSESNLDSFGAVSKPVCLQMASGVLFDNDYALSTTGIAGPTGDGICEKVGTVFIGLATKKNTYAYGFLFKGTREEIRENSVRAGLSILITELMLENQRIKK